MNGQRPDGQDPGTAVDDALLGPAFAAARRTVPQPTDALFARVLADANSVTALREVARPVDPIRPPRAASWPAALRDLFALVGGWPAVGGMATAGLAGVWIGFAGLVSIGDGTAWVTTGGGVTAEAGASGGIVDLLPGASAFDLAGTAGGEE